MMKMRPRLYHLATELKLRPRRGESESLTATLLEGLVGVLGTLTIGYLDWVTGVELRFFPFYFVPVGLLAWRKGLWPGLVVSVVAILVWEYAYRLAGGDYSSAFVRYWNVTVQWGSLLAFAAVLDRLRLLVQTERQTARVDRLTGAGNARALKERLSEESERSRRKGTPLTVAYLDVDGFKSVNDQYGHHVGDEVLVALAAALRASVRVSDYIARLGGDEFVLLLPETDPKGAEPVIARVMKTVSREFQHRAWPITLSVGVAVFTAVPSEPEELLKKADELMYAAKKSGKNTYRLQEFV